MQLTWAQTNTHSHTHANKVRAQSFHMHTHTSRKKTAPAKPLKNYFFTYHEFQHSAVHCTYAFKSPSNKRTSGRAKKEEEN